MALIFAAPVAGAADRIVGNVTFVQNEVRGEVDGRVSLVSAGDSVSRDQVIRTGPGSSIVITFEDKTTFAIGPSAEVRIDEFVYRNGQPGFRSFDLLKGIFRFISGPGAQGHRYQVRTPNATIAVRGTAFDVRVRNRVADVVLHDGAVSVCSDGGTCRNLMPGLTVSVDNGMGEPRSLAPRDWTFTAPSNSSTPSQREALNLAGIAATRSAVALGAAIPADIPRRCRTRSRVRHVVRPCRHIGTARFDRKRRRWQFQRRVRLGNSRQFWGQRQSRGQSERISRREWQRQRW